MKPAERLQVLLREAVAHHQAGRYERADALYRQLAASQPAHAPLSDLRGQLALQQGRVEEGIRLLGEALARDPRAPSTLARLTTALLAAGQGAQAEAAARRFTEGAPAVAEGWSIRGFVLTSLGRLAEARVSLERALQLQPRLVEAWFHHGQALAMAGRAAESLASYERALALAPTHLAARFGRAQALQKCYRGREAVAEYDAVLRADPRHLDARSCRLFALQNLPDVTPERLLAEHRAYGAAVGAGPDRLPVRDPDPERKLRVAVVSPDLRRHSCAYFLEPLLRHVDPEQFEVHLYHDHPHEDEVSARLRAGAAAWRNLAGRPQAEAERIIRGDRPDVAIDLAGHIGTSLRLPLFARRLAPVQVTYLGYPDTTGVPAMDFRFTDAQADPPGASDHRHTETLIRFAPAAWCYAPPPEAPEVASRAGGAEGGCVFGCFNNPAKFNADIFRAWARLLAEVPDSRLLLKGRDFQDETVRVAMETRLQDAGVPRERVDLLPRTAGTREHLEAYGRVDVALDTFPYHGTTTTCEALWMGVPVVTQAGERHASRVGVSLLTAVGHPEWVAQSADDYVRIAVGLGRDAEARARWRTRLREEMRRSVLCDCTGQAERFWAALRECWRRRVGAEWAPPALSA